MSLLLALFVPFLLILLRLAALLAVAPMFAGEWVPVRFRILLAGVLSLMLGMHQLPGFLMTEMEASKSLTAFIVAGCGEIVFGAMLGACVLMIFGALTVAGSAISHASGLAFPVDSGVTKDQQPILAQMLYALGIAAVFASGGHRMILESLMQTFTAYPPGAIAWEPDLFRCVMDTFLLGFTLGVHLALPVLVLLLAVQLTLAILHRVLPQVNAFAMCFPLNALLVLGILSLTLGGGLMLFQEFLHTAVFAGP